MSPTPKVSGDVAEQRRRAGNVLVECGQVDAGARHTGLEPAQEPAGRGVLEAAQVALESVQDTGVLLA